jgi:hypothetical protein
MKEIKPCEPRDSQSVISQNSGVLGYDALSVGELFWDVSKALCFPPKHREPLTQQHSIISQQTRILRNNASF